MKVSVIIPVYNVKPYLERCVQSVLGQTYKDIEMILVDDGSTDGSGQLCDELAAKHGQIRVIHQENQGLSVARNVGIQQATGEYIVFLDSDDDWLLKDGLQQIVNKVEEGTDLIIFKCVHIYNGDIQLPMKDYDIKNIEKLKTAAEVFKQLVRSQRFSMSACFLMVRRNVLVEHNIFFPVGLFSEDVYWSMHLWQYVNQVTIINLNFYGYHHRAGSISSTTTIQVYDSYDRIFNYWKGECAKGCDNSETILAYLSAMWVNRSYAFYTLPAKDKPVALVILQRHADLLHHAFSPKTMWARIMVKMIGVQKTATLLGAYWRMRVWFKGYVI